MYRNEKKLFAERTGSLVQSLQEPDTFKRIFGICCRKDGVHRWKSAVMI